MEHGGDLSDAMKRHGGSLAEWLDLSTGINPFSWPLPVTLPGVLWQRLPSRKDFEILIAAAREAYRVPVGTAIIAAPGTQTLIQWLPHLAAPGAVAVIGPTYDEHARSWARSGREVLQIEMACPVPKTVRHVVLVNPNNPDGGVTHRTALEQIGAELVRRGGWLIVDESFADVDPDIWAAHLCAHLPVVVLRSFGKFFGLAGLRLGFAISPPAIAQRLAEALGPWAVSGPALAIGHAALSDLNWATKMRERLRIQATLLDSVLTAFGLDVVGGTPLYRLASHPEAKELHDALAKQHIWTRRFTWNSDLLRFGLPPDEAGLKRLAAALATER